MSHPLRTDEEIRSLFVESVRQTFALRDAGGGDTYIASGAIAAALGWIIGEESGDGVTDLLIKDLNDWSEFHR